jgi:2-dehydropantoate 2-reductase
MVFKRVIVFGAGSVGCLLGALLSKQAEVILIARPNVAQAINENGLKVTGTVKGEFELHAETELKEVPEQALVIMAVKDLDLEAALREIKPKLKRDSTVMLVQNGLGVEEIADSVGVKAIRCIVQLGADLRKPNEVFSSFGKSALIFPDTVLGQELAEFFRKTKLGVKIANDFRQAVWRKMIVNCMVNPLTALINEPNSKVFESELKPLRQELFNECSAVAEAEGVDLGDFQLERLEKGFRKSLNYSSMVQDIRQHRSTEIDFLNGKIIELAEKHGLDVPFNRKVVKLIKEMEEIKCKI